MDEPRRGGKRLLVVLATVVAGLLVLAIVVAYLSRPDGRLEGVVTQRGRPVPGARVVVTVSLSNRGTVRSIPIVRPFTREVRADAVGRYLVERVRTDVVLDVFALPPTGAGGIAPLYVQAVPGETVRQDLTVPTRVP